MPVKINEQSEEQKGQEEAVVKSKQDVVSDKILSSLDLPEDEKPSEEGRQVQSKEPLDEEEDDDEEDDEEEVIPKSKFEKRLSSEVAKRKILEAELAEIKEQKSAVPNDRRSQLEAMSEAEQKQMKLEARSKWFDAKSDGDDALARQYMDLETELDEIIKTTPNKFVSEQVKAYDKAAKEVMLDPDNEGIDFNDEKEAGAIKSIATEIYKKYPELQNLKTGQATALKMAVDHYRETKDISKGKSKVSELKQKNNKLKRKTSLDSSKLRGQLSRGDAKKLVAQAKSSGSIYEKTAALETFLDIDSYLPTT